MPYTYDLLACVACIFNYKYTTCITTHDRHFNGVHWPIRRSRCRGSGTKGDLSPSTGGAHRGAGWGTEAVIHVTTRGLDHIIDGSEHAQARDSSRIMAMDRLIPKGPEKLCMAE